MAELLIAPKAPVTHVINDDYYLLSPLIFFVDGYEG